MRREDAIHDTDAGRNRRHKGADLRQQRDQGGLPQIGGLAGHVRPGQNVNQLARRETRVVGHKRFVACLLHNRMTPSRDGDGGAVIKLGAAVSTLQRDFPPATAILTFTVPM